MPSQQPSSSSSYLEVLPGYSLSRGAEARKSTLLCWLFMTGFKESRICPRPNCTYLGGSNHQCLEEMAAIKLKQLMQVKWCRNLFYTREYVATHRAGSSSSVQHSYLHMTALSMFLTSGRLRRQQDQSGQTSSIDSRASLQSHEKLQDGRNNNLLGHGCTRGCSS